MSTSAPEAAPSLIAIAAASAILAGVVGYFLGQFSTLGTVSNDYTKSNGKAKSSDGESECDDSEDESISIGKQQLNGFTDRKEECKLVLVVRTDLGMTKGASR